MLASFLAGCSSFFYKEQVSITGIYWISNSKAIELDLLFMERSSFNPLDGTTVKKGFRTVIKVIDISQNPIEEQLLTTIDGQLSIPGKINGQEIELTDNAGLKKNYQLKTNLSIEAELKAINKENQYLYRESASAPVKVKQRTQ
jgi:hypothetical protein